MNILAFDTCFDACSVAVARSGEGGAVALASALERFETGHAERLMPMIEEVMLKAGVAFADLDRLAVTVGPGTFTGTRIGIAAARGLALATGIAVVGTTSLAVMAEVAACELEDRRSGAELAVAVDARRGEVYVQLFGKDGLDVRSPPLLLNVEEAARLASEPLLVVGSGGVAVAAAAARQGRHLTAQLPGLLPEAAALARMAVDLAPEGEPLAPLYLRPPDAKPQSDKSIARALR